MAYLIEKRVYDVGTRCQNTRPADKNIFYKWFGESNNLNQIRRNKLKELSDIK